MIMEEENINGTESPISLSEANFRKKAWLALAPLYEATPSVDGHEAEFRGKAELTPAPLEATPSNDDPETEAEFQLRLGAELALAELTPCSDNDHEFQFRRKALLALAPLYKVEPEPVMQETPVTPPKQTFKTVCQKKSSCSKNTARWRKHVENRHQALLNFVNARRAKLYLPPVSLGQPHTCSHKGKARPNYFPEGYSPATMTDAELRQWRMDQRFKRKAAKQQENRILHKQKIEELKLMAMELLYPTQNSGPVKSHESEEGMFTILR